MRAATGSSLCMNYAAVLVFHQNGLNSGSGISGITAKGQRLIAVAEWFVVLYLILQENKTSAYFNSVKYTVI